MKQLSLSEKLYEELKLHNGEWIKKVELFVFAEQLGYSPETCGRRLRELVNEGKIEAGKYDGKYAKGLVKYSYNPPKDLKAKIEIVEINGERIARQIYA
jgi:DNA-binding Lrp family transcriptional regulator